MTQKKSQMSKSTTADSPEDTTSEMACSDSKQGIAVDETLASSSMAETALQGETEQSLGGNGNESNATSSGHQNLLTTLVVEAETTDEATNESGQSACPSSSPLPSAIHRNTNTILSSNLPAEDLQAAAVRRILSQQLAHQAQAHSPRNIASSNEQVLDQQSSFLAHPLIAVSGIPLAMIPPVPPPPSALHSNLLETLPLSQNQSNNLHLFPPSPTVLLGQPQLASFTQNVPAHASQAQLVAAQIQLASLLASAGQANNGPHMPPLPTLAALLLAHSNASSNLNITRQAEYPSQLNQNHEHLNRVEQLVALLLSQQQLGSTNTTSMSGPTQSFTNQERLLLQQLNAGPESTPSRTANFTIPAGSAVFPPFLHSVSNVLVDNAMTYRGFVNPLDVPPSILQLGNRATAPTSAVGSSFLNHISNQLAQSPTPNHILHTDQELSTESALMGPSHSKEKRWMIRYEELKQFQKKYGHCRVPHGYEENRKLSWWVMNQRAQYQMLKKGKPSWLSEERVALLDRLGFDWNPIIGKSCKR